MKWLTTGLLLLYTSVCLAQTTADISWYKMLQGKIGTYPVTMHLHKAGHEYRGFYYYDNYQKPFSFFGDDTSAAGQILLMTEKEKIVFTLKDGAANGTLTKTEAKPLAFLANEIKPPVGFTYIYSSGSAKLKPKLKESPQATIGQSSVWPTGNSASDLFIKNLVRTHFRAANSKEDIGAIFAKDRKKTLGSYIEDNKTVTDEDAKASAYSYSMESVEEMMVCYQSTKILSLAGYSYSYTGGAHANYGTTYIPVNLSTNKVLTVDDILTKEGVKSLNALLEKNFRRQYAVKTNESLKDAGLFENKIEPNKNFFATGKGIVFAYNPYEIGPFAMGEINIFIPFSDLKKCLKPEFTALVGNME